MESGEKHWAKEYLLDPLNAPEPAEETGPGSHFVRPASTAESESLPSPSHSTLSSKNPYRRLSKSHKAPSTVTSEVSTKNGSRAADSYPSPPHSASPRQSHFSSRHRSGSLRDDKMSDITEVPTTGKPRRSSSLRDKYPNDPSVHPLDQIKRAHKTAHRSPHLRKTHQIRPDTIDQLDNVGASYHHEGPFDATYASRNRSFLSSPVEAVSGTNEETLKATPRERVLDSVRGHRPLDGVAAVPSGLPDREGRVFRYKEGENMMVDGNPEGGAYKRWPGIPYARDDIKGKGEPSYSVEKALKEHKGHESHRRVMSDGIEMAVRPRSAGSDTRDYSPAGYHESVTHPIGSPVGRSNTVESRQRSGSGTLKKRFGSMKKQVTGTDN